MIDILPTVAGLALLAIPSVLLPAALRIRGRAPFAVGVLVAAAGQVVLAFTLLSLVDALTRGALLGCHLGFTAIAAGAWLLSGRPRPPRGYLPFRAVLRPRALWALLREHGAVALMAISAAAALAVQLFMAIAVAPNNWDSMAYHLSRAAYWLQYDSATQFVGGTVRQLGSPPNAEMLQAWTMAMSGGDAFTQVVQWLALVGIGLVTFSGARMLGFRVAHALFAAAVFVVLPQPMLQAATTQNDLLVAFFVVATGLFGARGLRDRSYGDLAVAAAALGLAVGTKGTAIIAGPSLLLILGLAAWRFRLPRRTLVLGATFAVAGVAALGAFNYVLNLNNTGEIQGGIDHPRGLTVKRESAVPGNLARVTWTFVDLPGISSGWIEMLVRRPATELLPDVERGGLGVARDFSYRVDSSIQEDTTAFGGVGFLLLFPLLLAVLVLRRFRGPPRVVAAAALLYLLAFSLTAEYNTWVGRVLLPLVGIAAPLFALLARRPWLRTFTVVLAIAGLLPVILANPSKTLLVEKDAVNVLDYPRLTQQTLTRPEMGTVMVTLGRRVEPDAPLGFVGGEDSWDYPLFGESLERRVVRLAPDEATYQRMEQEGLAGILIHGPPPEGLRHQTLTLDYHFAPARPPGQSAESGRTAAGR